MPGIQLTGLSSGLDTAAIIDSLMAIERLPRQRLSYQQVAAEAKRTALTDIQGKLSSLKTAASDLSSVLTWSDTQSLTISDSAKLGATKAGGVGPGTYNFQVTQMAAAERRTYSFLSPPVPVTLTIGSGGSSSTVDLDAGSTIEDAVARINANADTGVFAVKVGGDIVLASRTTGASSTISLSTDGGLTEVPATSVVAGKDAIFTVDGGAPQTSSTNTITNAIPGLDITLKGITGSGGVDVTIGNPGADTTAIKTQIKSFIAAYNDAMALMRTKYDEKSVNNPKNNVDAGKGTLRGDPELSRIMSGMRASVTGEVTGADPALNLLSLIGISTGAATGSATLNQDSIAGKLTFDETKFDAAFGSDPVAVKKLLGGSGSAFGQAFASMIDEHSSATGQLSARVTQSDSTIQSVKDSLARFDLRLDARQQFLSRQFQQMEAALSASRAVGDRLSAQLSGLTS
jgi:flagellar hook-associated protein 2